MFNYAIRHQLAVAADEFEGLEAFLLDSKLAVYLTASQFAFLKRFWKSLFTEAYYQADVCATGRFSVIKLEPRFTHVTSTFETRLGTRVGYVLDLQGSVLCETMFMRRVRMLSDEYALLEGGLLFRTVYGKYAAEYVFERVDCFTPAGAYLVLGTNSKIDFFDSARRKTVFSIAFGHDIKRIVAGRDVLYAVSEFYIFEVRGGQVIRQRRIPYRIFSAAMFRDDLIVGTECSVFSFQTNSHCFCCSNAVIQIIAGYNQVLACQTRRVIALDPSLQIVKIIELGSAFKAFRFAGKKLVCYGYDAQEIDFTEKQDDQ